MNTSTQSQSSYFNLITSGIGYLDRIREVPPKKGSKGKPFLACQIAALCGPSDDVAYRYFDVVVSGTNAQELVRQYQEDVEAGSKVLINFRLGDLWTDIFTFSKGKHAGETGVSLKARLLFIKSVKVDGELVYQAESNDEDQAPEEIQEEEPVPQKSAARNVKPVRAQPQAARSQSNVPPRRRQAA